MKIDKLQSACEKAIDLSKQNGLPAVITLNLPKGSINSKTRKLFGNLGPAGAIVAWGFGGYDTVMFNAQEVLSFILKHRAELDFIEANK